MGREEMTMAPGDKVKRGKKDRTLSSGKRCRRCSLAPVCRRLLVPQHHSLQDGDQRRESETTRKEGRKKKKKRDGRPSASPPDGLVARVGGLVPLSLSLSQPPSSSRARCVRLSLSSVARYSFSFPFFLIFEQLLPCLPRASSLLLSIPAFFLFRSREFRRKGDRRRHRQRGRLTHTHANGHSSCGGERW